MVLGVAFCSVLALARCDLMVHPFVGGEVGLSMAKRRRLRPSGSPLGV